jgi:23S rRNA pseudouridine2604 synthase
MEPLRINKYLSNHGYCSRREADRLIEAGKVFIDEKVAKLGDKVTDDNDVRVLGRDKRKPPEKIYIMLNKPSGVIVTTDRKKKDNVMNLVDIEERIFPIGRLDVKSAGLLLLTNDGILANRIMHPRYEHDKEYVVKIDRPISRKALTPLQIGVELEDGKTLPAQVRQMDETRFAIILKEGRNKQIRRMVEAIDYNVVELTRTRILSLKMPSTYPAGNWRHLTDGEVRQLRKAVGLKVKEDKAQKKPKWKK